MVNLFSSKATEFPKQLEWLNTKKKLSLEDLKGHIIVLDFWTYCCINCIHMLPDLKELEEKYKDKPVVFIGVHSAKFENENNYNNIQSAIWRYEIDHPVIIDSSHEIWNSYGISGWPSVVIIDSLGKVVYKNSGEGQKEYIDEVISEFLETGKQNKTPAKEKIKIIIPENQKKPVSTLSFPGKIFFSDDELIISDSSNNRVLVVKTDLEKNKANIIYKIGSGKSGLKDGEFKIAQFNKPQGICRKDNKIYVADTENHAIREIDIEKKFVKTVAGNGFQSRGPPKEGAAKEQKLNSPWDVLIIENVLYIAMAGSHQIWYIDLTSGNIKLYAGTGGEDIVDGIKRNALLAQPSGLATNGEDIFFADSETSSIRIIKGNTIETLIGHGLFFFGNKDGEFDQALLQHPLGLDYRNQKIYIADTYNHSIRIANLETRQLSTLIGHKEQKVCVVDDKTCNYLPLFEPNDVIALDEKLIIADTNNHLIRIFNMKTKQLYDLEIVF